MKINAIKVPSAGFGIRARIVTALVFLLVWGISEALAEKPRKKVKELTRREVCLVAKNSTDYKNDDVWRGACGAVAVYFENVERGLVPRNASIEYSCSGFFNECLDSHRDVVFECGISRKAVATCDASIGLFRQCLRRQAQNLGRLGRSLTTFSCSLDTTIANDEFWKGPIACRELEERCPGLKWSGQM